MIGRGPSPSGECTGFRRPPAAAHRININERSDYDVLGIGKAIVDILAKADDGFLAAQGMTKGAMA